MSINCDKSGGRCAPGMCTWIKSAAQRRVYMLCFGRASVIPMTLLTTPRLIVLILD